MTIYSGNVRYYNTLLFEHLYKLSCFFMECENKKIEKYENNKNKLD